MAKKANKKNSSADTYISMALGLAVVLLVGAAFFNILSKRTASSGSGQTEENAQRVSVPMIHKVQENDSLWSIATKYYQNGYVWVEIQKVNNLNNPDYLVVGQILTIPAVAQKAGEIDSLAASTDSNPLHESTTVAQGESLWSIAAREYGNPYRWSDIAKTNDIANPDIIYPGKELRLP